MTEEFFLHQISRLRTRFGAKAFDSEFVRILGLEVSILEHEFFRRTVDTWIGSRKNSSPPLLADFREARAAFDRSRLMQATKQAEAGFNMGLKEALKKHYKVETVKEAFELEKLKIRLGGDHDRKEGSSHRGGDPRLVKKET